MMMMMTIHCNLLTADSANRSARALAAPLLKLQAPRLTALLLLM